MEDRGTETITRVKVEFTEDEHKLLTATVEPPQSLAGFIHRVVMGNLKRKARKAKKENDNENQ